MRENKQTNKQKTNKQTSKQTNKQTNKQTTDAQSILPIAGSRCSLSLFSLHNSNNFSHYAGTKCGHIDNVHMCVLYYYLYMVAITIVHSHHTV